MKKRLFKILTMVLSIAMLLALVTGCTSKEAPAPSGGNQPANTQPTKAVTFRLSSPVGETHPAIVAFKEFTEWVKGETNGGIDIAVFPAAALGEMRDNLEGLKADTLELCHCTTGPLAQFTPELDFINLPYMFESPEHIIGVMNSDTGKDIVKIIEDGGFKYLAWLYGGARSIITDVGPVYKPEDLHGLKIRVMTSDLMVNSINAMGAIATPMGQGDVYSALQQGILDGWENSPTTLYTLKLYEVSKYMSFTNHFICPDLLLMSPAVWSRMTPEQQNVLTSNSKRLTDRQVEIWMNEEDKTVEALKDLGVSFNDVDIGPFREAVKPVWDSYIKKYGTGMIEAVQAAAK